MHGLFEYKLKQCLKYTDSFQKVILLTNFKFHLLRIALNFLFKLVLLSYPCYLLKMSCYRNNYSLLDCYMNFTVYFIVIIIAYLQKNKKLNQSHSYVCLFSVYISFVKFIVKNLYYNVCIDMYVQCM